MAANTPETVEFVVEADEEDGGYFAYCDQLHAVTQGDTFDEIVYNVREVAELALEGDVLGDYGLTSPPTVVVIRHSTALAK